MQLQYVLANPAPKRSKKRKQGVHNKRKARKIKKVGGNPVAKRKRMKKGSKEAKAWGRKMKRLRASGNPKRKSRGRKRRKNPYYYQGEGRVPVTRKIKGRSIKFYSPHELDELDRGYLATIAELEAREQAIRSRPMQDLWISKELGELKQKKAEINKLRREAKKQAAELAKERKKFESAEKFKNKILQAGGSVKEVWSNPRDKKGKKKNGSRKGKRRTAAQRAATKKMIAANKKRRRSKRESGAHVFKAAKTFKFKRAKKKVRVKMIGVVNPNWRGMVDAAKGLALPAVYAASGYLAINFVLIPLIDKFAGNKLPGGSIAGSVAKIPGIGPVIAPYSGAILGAAGGLVVSQLVAPRIRNAEVARQVRLAGIGAAGLAMTLVVLDNLKQYALPRVAKAIGLQPQALSGVMYFPMSGADFGMYPQMGQYHQKPGDWGFQTVGGMRGVEFFPNRGMNGVEYFPDGADGDRMYPQDRADTYAAAEGGLGEIPAGLADADFGEIPEGLADADFGEIPYNMG